MAEILKDFSETNRKLAKKILEEQATGRKTKPLIGSTSITSGARAGALLGDMQRKEATLVGKLSKDFPIRQFDSMPTKAQLKAVQYSGLNPNERWNLLNLSMPIETLSMLNDIENRVSEQTITRQDAAALTQSAVQLAAEQQELESGNTAYLPPLQKNLLRTELEGRKDVLKRIIETGAPLNYPERQRIPQPTIDEEIAQPPVSIPTPEPTPVPDPTQEPMPIAEPEENHPMLDLWNDIKAWVIDVFTPKDTAPQPTPEPTPQLTPQPTPQIITLNTIAPSPEVPMTPTPFPTPSERERRAQAAVDAALGYAVDEAPYTKGGSSPKTGFDCSGLVRFVSSNTNLKFGEGYLSKSAQYMVDSFYDHQEYGDIIYKYTEDNEFPPLKTGDLVFSANPDNLKLDRHVTMATGNDLQVVEASDRRGVERVTSDFDAYDTRNDEGLYVRGTGQIITYVIRPNY